MKINLRRGDLVEVKSANEILSSLDGEGACASLPFMPEMIQYCGRRFVVYRRADKICDTINYHQRSRKMSDTVILEDLRCDGSAHDSCQAECRLFWKESWLRRVGTDTPSDSGRIVQDELIKLKEFTTRYTHQTREIEGHQVDVYQCQATELNKASTLLGLWDPRPYFHEVANGNVTIIRFLQVFPRAFTEMLLLKIRRILLYRILGRSDNWTPVPGTRIGPSTIELYNLQPGDWVQVKTKKEIIAILTPDGKDRGLSFDREMLPYCGKIYRVRQRINQIIDDRNGQMIEFKSDCVTLDGVVCSGDLSVKRYFCPRGIYPYWRENWLRPVNIKKSDP